MEEVELADARPRHERKSVLDGRSEEQQPLVPEQLRAARPAQQHARDCARCLPQSPRAVWAVALALFLVLLALTAGLLYFSIAAERSAARPEEQASTCSLAGASLYDAVRPEAYSLAVAFTEANLDPDPAAASHTFSGTCRMAFKVTAAASAVRLHSAKLNFSAVSLEVADGTQPRCLCGPGPGCGTPTCGSVIAPVRAPAGCGGVATDVVQVKLGGATLLPGQAAVLELHYTGTFSADNGIYRSDLFEASNGPGVLLVTQLEAFGARHAMPCIDEPQAKAVFSVQLDYPADLTALTNTPAVGPPERLADGRVRQRFAATPLMSPYLLALAVGNLVSLSAETDAGVKVAVWSVPRLRSQLHLPLQLAVWALEHYAAWTGVPQPLAKFDLVAVPGKQGAMENWGLLHFDERRFLWAEETEGAYGQWLAADVICHEVAHQWFGNLVTCRDWAHLTVNEGLASFMEYGCVEAVLLGAQAAALRRRATSPMGESIGVHEGPRRVALLSDTDPGGAPLVSDLAAAAPSLPSGEVTYSKGASLLAMLQAFVDARQPGSFQAGLRAYLRKHAYGTATVDDVLKSVLASYHATGMDKAALAQQLAAWFYRPGYPLLNVTPADASATGGVRVQQSRYLAWGGSHAGNSDAAWTVPVALGNLQPNASSQAEGQRWHMLRERTSLLQQPFAGTPPWMLDPQATGLFRVAYTPDDLLALAPKVQQLTGEGEGLQAAAALLDDAFALLETGAMQPGPVFALAAAAAAAPAAVTPTGIHLLLGTLLDRLASLRHMLSPDAACTRDMDAFVASMTASATYAILAAVGNASGRWQDLPFLSRLSQGDVLREAALAGSSNASAFLCGACKASLTGGKQVHPDLRGAAYIAAVVQPPGCELERQAATAPAAVVDRMLAKWGGSEDIEERRRGLFAAARVTQPDLVPRVAELLLDPRSALALADRAAAFRLLLREPATSAAAWRFVRDRWHDLSTELDMWALLDQVPLPPVAEWHQELHGLAGAGEHTATQQRLLGRLHHGVGWLAAAGSEVCGWLRQRSR